MAKDKNYVDGTIEEYRYSYEGPVFCFGKIINEKFKATTIATTKKKAVTNIKDQYKRWYGLSKSHKLDLNEDYVICISKY